MELAPIAREQTNPDVKVGQYRGFSVDFRMPEGAYLTGFGKVNTQVLIRMLCLGKENTTIEVTGMAPANQPGLKQAVDSMLASLAHTEV